MAQHWRTAPPSILTWLEQGTIAMCAPAANWSATGIHHWHLPLCCFPRRNTPEFSLVPKGQYSFSHNLKMRKGSELLKLFFPSSFLKMEGAKASQRFTVVSPAHRDPGSPAVCMLAFSLASQAPDICACPVPSPAAPCLPVNPWGRMPPSKTGSSKTLLVTTLS